MSHNATASEIVLMISLIKLAIVALGGLITYFSYKGYRATGQRSLLYLSLGFSLVVLGSLLGGTVHVALDLGILLGVLLDSSVTALGFGVITYSLYTE